MATGTRCTAAIAAANAADRDPATPTSSRRRGAADAAPASSPSKARSALMRSRSVPDVGGPQGCCSATSTSLRAVRSSPSPAAPPSSGTGRREAGSKIRDEEDATPPGGFAWRMSSGASLPATLPDDPLLWLLPAGAAAAGCKFNSATSEEAAVGWRSKDKSAEMAVASSRMPLRGAVTAVAAAAAVAGATSRDGELLVSATTTALEAVAVEAAVAPCTGVSLGSCSNPDVPTLASPPPAAAGAPAAAAAAAAVPP